MEVDMVELKKRECPEQHPGQIREKAGYNWAMSIQKTSHDQSEYDGQRTDRYE